MQIKQGVIRAESKIQAVYKLKKKFSEKNVQVVLEADGNNTYNYLVKIESETT